VVLEKMSELQKWLDDAAIYFERTWGLSETFAVDVAQLYLYLYYYRLNPTITSGYRSPSKQESLLQRYLAGDPSVVVKPATNSKHSITLPDGTPASEAIDISTSSPEQAAMIARQLGVGAGYYFSTPDPVHFYEI
jgi:hypothetical protein